VTVRPSRITTASRPPAHLRALGAPEPEMPPHDASKHEPIDEIPIEPDDAQPRVSPTPTLGRVQFPSEVVARVVLLA